MKGRNEMKKIILFLSLFLLICCINKNQELNSKNNKKNEKSITERKEVEKKYMTYSEFNKKYFYWNGGNSFLRSDSNKLEKYILKKEENLESFINSDGSEVKMEKILGKFSSEEDRILQIIKLLIEAEIEERKTIQFSSFYFNNRFLDELRENRNKLLNNFYNSENKEKILLSILEKNFTEEEIRIFFDLYYINGEFDNYEISGRYGLPKVDRVIAEVEKIEGIDEKEWARREMSPRITLFENEEEEVSNVHILKDNRIIIVDENQKPIKEIKVKDYRKIDLTIYKGILYIYDDGKIYEYSTKNLDDVKVIDVKNL